MENKIKYVFYELDERKMSEMWEVNEKKIAKND